MNFWSDIFLDSCKLECACYVNGMVEMLNWRTLVFSMVYAAVKLGLDDEQEYDDQKSMYTF